MGNFDVFEQNTAAHAKEAAEEYLDDITFIAEIKHTTAGPWHQYDVLLAARGYGWETMKDWADYMAEADLADISQVTTSFIIGANDEDITKSYLDNGGKCKQTPELAAEAGTLSVAGISKVLKAPIKMVWFNQTRVLRFFTIFDDEKIIARYAETSIRRTFGKADAMKLGKPIPDEQK